MSDNAVKFSGAVGDYVVECWSSGLPLAYEHYKKSAKLVEEFDVKRGDSSCCLTIARADDEWPFLVVAQGYSPGGSAGFAPGFVLVEETKRLFIGAGERLLAYSLEQPARLWEDTAEMGFSGWKRHGNVVVMSAELELAAWNLEGTKLWTTFVEPPWGYRIENGVIRLDVMGEITSFPIQSGRP